MDTRGDHAAMCNHGFGAVHRHNTVRNALGRHAFLAAGQHCDLEVPFLIPSTTHRPDDTLIQPAPPPASALPERRNAYDVIIHSPYLAGALVPAARRMAGAAEVADAALRPLDWHFVPLAFDTLGAPSAHTVAELDSPAHQIAIRIGTTLGTAKSRLSQRLSYAIWSSVAAATLARMPFHGPASSCPTQV